MHGENQVKYDKYRTGELMKKTWINAPAKINIGLDVLRKREDGYHEVKMIMQSIRLFDRLTFTETKKEDITLSTNLRFLPVNEDNLVIKAAKLLRDEFNITDGLHINLEKRIPVAAGMAGGSTDAASCMLALNKLYGLGLSLEQLQERAVSLGADIPYCLMKGTALSEGIGEKLTRLPNTPDCFILIAKPNIYVSTGSVYQNLVLNENTEHPDIDYMIKAIEQNNLTTLAKSIGNILESVTIPAHPEVAQIKECMINNGAMASLMSGSGPTVFGIFDDRDKAMFAKQKCRELPFKCFVYVTDFYR